jgi:hypothetical protein
VRLHDRLWRVCRNQEAYRSGTDTDNHNLNDCSCGCKYFHVLSGEAGSDWGVCIYPKSDRAGLLTFEHMGCRFYKDGISPEDLK